MCTGFGHILSLTLRKIIDKVSEGLIGGVAALQLPVLVNLYFLTLATSLEQEPNPGGRV